MNKVRIVPGKLEDAGQIAQVYIDAFPDSTAFYFPHKDRKRLEEAVKCGFQLILQLGAEALVAVDQDGAVAGYCIFSSQALPHRGKAWGSIIKTGLRALAYLSPWELGKLAYSRVLFRRHVQLRDKLPPEGGRIVSIAVSRRFQGKGLGRKLLVQALTEMGPTAVLLEVRANNASAKALYHSCGFRSFGTTRDSLGPWVIMARPAPGGAKDPV